MKKEEMKTILEKYPFLVYRNIFSNKPLHDNPEEDLEINEYTSWNRTGWEKIWKRFLQEIFKEYDKLSDEDKKNFEIFDSKEKYGIEGVTYSGGEPTLQQNLPVLTKEIHNLGLGVISFTGRKYEEVSDILAMSSTCCRVKTLRHSKVL